MNHDLGRMLQLLSAGAHAQQPNWQPAVDVYRGDQGWLVKIELAGVTGKDIQISVSGSRLTISGIRRDRMIRQACQSYSMEISYNRFERTIELPCNLDDARVVSEYRDGMLHVFFETETK